MPDADNTTPKPLISQSEQSYERVQHLKDSGTRFLKLLALRAASVAQVKWKRKRLALRVLLEQRWTASRTPHRHLDLTVPERVSLYAPLAGIR